MVCLGFETGVAKWKAQTNPLSYDFNLVDVVSDVRQFHRTEPDRVDAAGRRTCAVERVQPSRHQGPRLC